MKSTICPRTLTASSPLIAHLWQKKKLLEKRDPRHGKIKTALIIKGGVMLGIYGGGVVMGLEALEMSDVFDFVIGESAGAPDCAYFLSHQTELGCAIYYDDLVKKQFRNFLRFTKILDLDYFENVMRTKKVMDTKKVKASRSTFFVSVTNAKTHKGELLHANAKDVDVIDAIIASCSHPYVYKSNKYIHGTHYFDGQVSFPFLIDYAVKDLQCTDILVITNRSCSQKPYRDFGVFDRLLEAMYFRLRYHTRSRCRENEGKYVEDMGFLWQNESAGENVNVGLVCPNAIPFNRFGRNSTILKQFAYEAKQQVIDLFNGRD